MRCMHPLRVVAEVGHHNVEDNLNMAPSTIITERSRFMRTMNQVGNFMSHIINLSQPLRKLLTKNRIYTWDPAKPKHFSTSKKF